MPTALIRSRAQIGMSAPEVVIEVHLSAGLPAFNIVGLPEKAVRESRDRVRSALLNNGFAMPIKRITVNLAPADLPKQGGRYDLPIAIGLLVAANIVEQKQVEHYEFIGELGLLGDLRSCPSVLAMALACQQSQHALIVPRCNLEHASLVKDLTLYAADQLVDVVAHLQGIKVLPVQSVGVMAEQIQQTADMSDIAGHAVAKRALVVAAAGGHSVLMQGSPGSGKSMLAQRLPSILPALTFSQAVEVAIIHSLSSNHNQCDLFTRPFRSPHHSASAVALVGGGSPPQPGEVSLAHNGILFLDEFLEFSRSVLEALREPMETGDISISRASYHARFPARCQLIAAMNPCPCGYLFDKKHHCRCSAEQINRYQSKLSGPMVDRIDIHLEIECQPINILIHQSNTEASSRDLRHIVEQAQQRQIKRQGKLNAFLNTRELRTAKWLRPDARLFLSTVTEKLGLSSRAYLRTIKLARTLADIDKEQSITKSYLSEALSWRQSDVFPDQ